MTLDTASALEPDPPAQMPRLHRLLLVIVAVVVGTTLVLTVLGALAGKFAISALWPDPRVVSTSLSPDGEHELSVMEYDHGALGGEVVVELAGDGVESRSVAVHGTWGARPSVRWVDRDTFVIDGEELDVHTRKVLHLDD